MKIIIFFVVIFSSCANVIAQIELPMIKQGDIVMRNKQGRYTFKYMPQHLQSHWVAYKLTSDDIKGSATRASSFKTDSLIIAAALPYATTGMYKNSGYDRGHLLASADRKYSEQANRSTFLMTNVSPQTPSLNRGPWKFLEEQIRRWTQNHDTIYIVCGPIIENEEQKKISDKITVPNRFYKAILFRKGDHYESRCYIMPNDTLTEKDFNIYNVSLDSLESASGIDLIWNNPRK